MSTKAYKYVILGGGIVAGYAARTFVEQGEGVSAQLCIVSADNELPYDRPSLSKDFLAGTESMDDILINPSEYYERNDIDIRLETVVGRIDCDHKLLYAGNDTIGYERLLIATGARPKELPVPGFGLQGIHTLRLATDSARIREEAHDAQRAVVIGGSFIGMEVGSVLQRLGVETTIVFPEERVWQALFTPEISHFFEAYYEDKGVTFVKGASLREFIGDNDRVQHVVLDSGQKLPADMVVAGVGVVPTVEMFRDTPLRMDDGIIVNRFLRTIDPDIFAAGDVARYHDPVTDKLRRIEHWDNAKSQGQHAARGMLGILQEYRHVPYFFSDVFDLSYEFWGDTSDAATAIVRGDVDMGSFSTWWLDGEQRLVAALVLDRPEEERKLAPTWILEGVTLEPSMLRDVESLQGVEVAAPTQ